MTETTTTNENAVHISKIQRFCMIAFMVFTFAFLLAYVALVLVADTRIPLYEAHSYFQNAFHKYHTSLINPRGLVILYHFVILLPAFYLVVGN